MRGQGKLAEKPTLKKPEVVKRVADRMKVTREMAKDFVDVYHSVLFDAMLENYEVHLQYIGRIWISEPRIKAYGDFETGERKEGIMFPIIKFKPMQTFRTALRGPRYKELKEAFEASLQKAIEEEQDVQFDKVFKTDVQPKNDYSHTKWERN